MAGLSANAAEAAPPISAVPNVAVPAVVPVPNVVPVMRLSPAPDITLPKSLIPHPTGASNAEDLDHMPGGTPPGEGMESGVMNLELPVAPQAAVTRPAPVYRKM